MVVVEVEEEDEEGELKRRSWWRRGGRRQKERRNGKELKGKKRQGGTVSLSAETAVMFRSSEPSFHVSTLAGF